MQFTPEEYEIKVNLQQVMGIDGFMRKIQIGISMYS